MWRRIIRRNINDSTLTKLQPLENNLKATFKKDGNYLIESKYKALLNVALIGKPNVGKSTLFNRLCGSNAAIVSPIAGTTRDRKEGMASIGGLRFKLIDTGGFDDRGHVANDVQKQIYKSLIDADVLVFMVDGKNGVNSIDVDFANWIRKVVGELEMKHKRPSGVKREIILISNKTEGGFLCDKVLTAFSEGTELGWGAPILLSAAHGEGMGELAQSLIKCAQLRGYDTIHEVEIQKSSTPPLLALRTIQLAFMGSPNVGKSSLLNAILNDERVLSGPIPGLTRDAIYVDWFAMERHFCLVDTAGLSRIHPDKRVLKGKSDKKLLQLHNSTGKVAAKLPGCKFVDPESDPSQFSQQISEQALESALYALRFSQVVLLVVEGAQGTFRDIDLKLTRKCLQEGRALVVVANKRDLLMQEGTTPKMYEEGVRNHCSRYLREFGTVPIVSTSATQTIVTPPNVKKNDENIQFNNDKALSNPSRDLANISKISGIEKLLKVVIQTHDAWSKRIDTGTLNGWLADLQVAMPTTRYAGRKVNVKYITQVKTRPPCFALFSNTSMIPLTYLRFLRAKIQDDFGFNGIPIRFLTRKSEGKPAQKKLLFRTRRVQSAGQTMPLGAKRDNPYLEMKRKAARDIRRRRNNRLKSKMNRPLKGGNRARPPNIFFRKNGKK